LSGGGHVPPGSAISKLPSGGRVPPGAKRLRNSQRCRHRLAGLPLPLGAHDHLDPLIFCCRLTGQSPPPGATPVLAQYWLCPGSCIIHTCHSHSSSLQNLLTELVTVNNDI